jgi:hypothetical protein
VKALEFSGSVDEGGRILVPSEVLAEVPSGEQLSVVVMWDPLRGDDEWFAGASRAFEGAYSTEDAVYEQLMQDNAERR